MIKALQGKNILFPTPIQLCLYTPQSFPSEHIILIVNVFKNILLLCKIAV